MNRHRHQLSLLKDTGGWQLELQGMFLLTAIALLLIGAGRLSIKAD